MPVHEAYSSVQTKPDRIAIYSLHAIKMTKTLKNSPLYQFIGVHRCPGETILNSFTVVMKMIFAFSSSRRVHWYTWSAVFLERFLLPRCDVNIKVLINKIILSNSNNFWIVFMKVTLWITLLQICLLLNLSGKIL